MGPSLTSVSNETHRPPDRFDSNSAVDATRRRRVPSDHNGGQRAMAMTDELSPLASRGALVTGAGRGIGASIARALAAAGASVALVSRNEEELHGIADEIERLGGSACCIVADLAEDARGVASSALEALGQVDILVNNAAVQAFAPVLEFDQETFRETVAVNLTAPFILAQAVLPGMISRREGWIVNISSDLAYRVRHGGAAYCSTKRALLALSEVLQLEHRADGIRVSVILPGITATTWDGKPADHPSKRDHLHPTEIAEAVLWCCTRRSGARIDSIVIHPLVQDSV
jgi:NAD(P)-dependent dehydrogenase (short-subunit alcohol dehydrogenase family)